MKIQEERQFRIPIDELRALLRGRFGIDFAAVEPSLEQDNLVFSVRSEVSESGPAALETEEHGLTAGGHSRTRRKRRRRNRIRVKGWKVVAKIRNSKGLSANIYEPIVAALEEKAVARSEQRKLVRQLMIQNGNDPSSESVEYFLQNTLEYIARKAENGSGSQ